MTKEEIIAALNEAGIEHDGRSSKETLQALLPRRSDLVTCRVIRDYWPEEDVRVPKGTVEELLPMAALDALEAGTHERVR